MYLCLVLLYLTLMANITSADCFCPRPWTHFRDHCYIYVPTRANFNTAESNCAKLPIGIGDGHLVSILDDLERRFLEASFNPATYRLVWIGLSDIVQEDEFVWTDGSFYNFTYFNDGEPNNDNDSEDCVYRDLTGGWNDHPCENEKPFICKANLWDWSNCSIRR